MTPLAAFQDTIDRATLLLEMQDLFAKPKRLVVSQEKADALKGVFGWPKAAPISRIDTRTAIIVGRPGATLQLWGRMNTTRQELLRAALVVGVSALDRYVHERVTKGIVSALRKRNLNRQQRDFTIPVAAAVRIAAHVRANHSASVRLRPANEIRKAVQEAIHKRPYQGWRDIESAFELLGITGLAGRLQVLYKIKNFTPIRAELGEIVRRRNQIVHEGDLKVYQRGGPVRRNGVDQPYVKRALDFLQLFVSHLERV